MRFTRANIPTKGVIATKGNLSSAVFADIYASLGLDASQYSTKFNLIDESLLRRRNSIAHGEYLDVDEVGFLQLAGEVLHLLRCVKTDIENYVATKSYLHTPAPNSGLQLTGFARS